MQCSAVQCTAQPVLLPSISLSLSPSRYGGPWTQDNLQILILNLLCYSLLKVPASLLPAVD